MSTSNTQLPSAPPSTPPPLYSKNLRTLLEIVDTYKEEIPDGTYLNICQDLKRRFQSGSQSDNNHTADRSLLIEDKIDPSLSPLYQYLIVCVLEQRGPNSINGILPRDSLPASPATREEQDLLLHYIDSVEEDFYFLNRMKGDKSTLTVTQTRDCQTFQTGNHYARIVFTTYHQESKTYYNLSFSAKFRQDGLNISGDQKIHISYSTDLVVDKNQKPLPYTMHTIGIDKDTRYHRTTIFSTSVYHLNTQITSLPTGYLVTDLMSPDYSINFKVNPDTCILS